VVQKVRFKYGGDFVVFMVDCPSEQVVRESLTILKTLEDFAYYQDVNMYNYPGDSAEVESFGDGTFRFLETCGSCYGEVIDNWGKHVERCSKCRPKYSQVLLDHVKTLRELDRSLGSFDGTDNDTLVDEYDVISRTY